MKKHLLMMLCCLAALIGSAQSTTVEFDFVNNDYGMSRESGNSTDYNPIPTTVTLDGVILTFDGGNNRLWSDGMRLYKESYIQISVPEGAKITAINATTTGKDFTICPVNTTSTTLASASSTAINWDASKLDYSEVWIRYTAAKSSKAISTLKVTYLEPEAGKEAADLKFAVEELTLTLGETVKLPELTKATDATATITSSDESVVTYNAESGEITAVKVGTAIIKASTQATDKYYAGEAALTIVVNPVEASYGIAGKVESGKKYLLVANGYATTGCVNVSNVPTSIAGKYGYMSTTAVEDVDGWIKTGDTYGMTITAVDGGYTIQNNDGLYLSASDNHATITLTDTEVENCIWTLTKNQDGTFSIYNPSASKTLQLDSYYNTFGVYAEASNLNPTLYVLGGDTSDPSAIEPVFTVSEDDWMNEAAGIVFKGATITISAPEGTEAGWIMGYSVNGAAEELAEEAVTLTINENTTITAYIDDETNTVSRTFKVAQIADLVIDPAFGAVAAGTEVTVSCPTEGALLHGFIGEETIEGAALPYTFTIEAETAVTLWAENARYLNSTDLEGTYTIMEPSLAAKWELVTSIDQIKDGDVVTFTAKEYKTYPSLVMSGCKSNLIQGAAYTFDNDEFSVPVFEMTISKASTDGKFTLYNNGNGYIKAGDKKVYFSDEPNEFDLSISSTDSSTAISTTYNNKSYTLQYNANVQTPVDITSARFTFYSSSQQPIYMYRQTSAEVSAAPTINGLEQKPGENQHNVKVGDILVIASADKDATISYLEEEVDAPAAIAPRAADATAEWVNTNENPYNYEVKDSSMGKRVTFAAVKNGEHIGLTTVTINNNGTITGIEGVEAEAANGEVEYFNLQGVRVANPTEGLYIRRQGNKVEKVAIR